LFSDEDGILRKYPLWQKSNDMFYPSLSNSYFEKIGKEIKLHFYGKGGDFEYLDAFKIYVAKKIQEEGEIKEVEEIKKRLEGKIVFLGVTATGGFDLKSVPTSKIYPGVEIHTTAFQNLKDLSFIKDFPFYLYLMISFLFIFIFFIILINSKLGLQILNLIIFYLE